jgi:hypothetical protein
MNETQYSYTLRDNVAELSELDTQSYSGGDVAVVLGDDILHKVCSVHALLRSRILTVRCMVMAPLCTSIRHQSTSATSTVLVLVPSRSAGLAFIRSTRSYWMLTS